MIIGWHEWLNLKIDKDGGGRRAGRSRSASASSTGSNEGDVRAAKILRIDLSRRWMEAAMEVLQYFTDRTPGAWIDVGESTVRWHWSDADETFGGTQAQVCLSTTKSVFSSLVLFFHPFIKKHEDDGQERTGCTSTLPSRKRVDALVCQWRGCSVL